MDVHENVLFQFVSSQAVYEAHGETHQSDGWTDEEVRMLSELGIKDIHSFSEVRPFLRPKEGSEAAPTSGESVESNFIPSILDMYDQTGMLKKENTGAIIKVPCAICSEHDLKWNLPWSGLTDSHDIYAILRCGHAFGSACLKDLATSLSPGTQVLGDCPFCREPGRCQLLGGRLLLLPNPTREYIVFLKAALAQPPDYYCWVCQSKEGKRYWE